MYKFATPLDQVAGIGDTISAYLEKKGVHTVGELLLNLPLHYSDLTQMYTCAQLKELLAGTPKVSLSARVEKIYRNRQRGWRAKLTDETGSIYAVWFNAPFVGQTLKVGQTYVFSGVYNPKYKNLTQPAFEPIDRETKLHTGRLVPVYSATFNVKQGILRRILHEIITHLDTLNLEFRIKQDLVTWPQVFSQLHFPENGPKIIQAREQLALEELLNLSASAKLIKQKWADNYHALPVKIEPKASLNNLPFDLTSAQLRSIHEIAADLNNSVPMNRLLMGDVGSGKTIVAGIVLAELVKQGKTGCLIAPTKILAEQHYQTLHKLLPDTPIYLVTAGTKFSADYLTKLSGSLIISTHTLLRHIHKLQPTLVVFDEQQRFGVEQRSLWQPTNQEKIVPHVLTMTATPIPRSLMLTVFSHLSLSLIDELPAGRLPNKTWYVPSIKRHDSWQWITQYITDHPKSICLVVCPFIEPSQNDALQNVKAVNQEYAKIRSLLPEGISSAVLHGRIKKDDQVQLTQKLYDGQINVLVASSIVEVGIDIPTADIMVIENAERFGLASLHQLRGRVGRNGQQGYCLLFSGSDNMARERLTKFAQVKSGQEVAELDLHNRGAGNLFGVEQSGLTSLRFASWTNADLLKKTQDLLTQLPANWQSPLFASLVVEKNINPN